MFIRSSSTRSPRALAVAVAALLGLLLVLVAACGGGGGGASVPACQTGTDSESQTPVPAPSLTLKTASYEGTGSPQCIRELGFQPVLVIIKGDTGAMNVWCHSSMQ